MSKGRAVPPKPLTPRQERNWKQVQTWASEFDRIVDRDMDILWHRPRKQLLRDVSPDKHDEFLSYVVGLITSRMWEKQFDTPARMLSYCEDEIVKDQFICNTIDQFQAHGAWGLDPDTVISSVIDGIHMAIDRYMGLAKLNQLMETDLHAWWVEIEKIFRDQNVPRQPGERGFIYLIKCGLYYKIGKARDVEKRLKGLKTGQPLPIELIHTISTNNTYRAEKFFHGSFESNRTTGEWFRLTPRQIEMFRDFKEINF